ncbi:MAG: PEP-CTERM sorting domain-containing protein [Hapalosiphonaceae cyanobacterium JJU2]|nr:MAG: PEP-CTERM sorting domain-containing protein [Hapalosiphonaceae cyanobacterium JJU2]
MQKISAFTKILIALSVSLGIAAATPSAKAASLVPQQEGEVQTNLGCLDPNQCINTNSLGYTVTSLDYDGAGGYGLSRLFVDSRTTSNTYQGQGLKVSFGTKDAGTNPALSEYWFRPVAITEKGKLPEGGQLEVGRFLFNFIEEMSEVSLDFFDVEDTGTAILFLNGEDITDLVLQAGKNNGIQSLTLYDVKSFEVQLGNAYSHKFKTGDGVDLRGTMIPKPVPEPGNIIGFGALFLLATFGLQQRKKHITSL